MKPGAALVAIDTNVVVRYLTGDHPEQSARARELVDNREVFVPVTVVLEAEWVLRSAYRFQTHDVVRALRAFGGLPTVTISKAEAVAEALDHAEKGMDFADALHLESAARAEKLLTFDKRFATAAGSIAPGRVEEL